MVWLISLLALLVCAPADAQNAREPVFSEHWVPVADGLKLYVRVLGNGPDTVLIPAAAYVAHDLAPLAAGRTLVFYDLRGRGASDAIPPGAGSDIEAEIRDLEAVRAYFGVDRASFLGWSYLGAVVALYAAEYPDRVRRVVQVGPVAPRSDIVVPEERRVPVRPEDAVWLEELREAGMPSTDPVGYCREWMRLSVLRTALARPEGVDRFGGAPCLYWNEWPAQLNRRLRQVMPSEWDFTERATAVEARVLTVHGTEDPTAAVEGGRAWAQLMPRAQLLELPGVGHAPWLESPEAFFGPVAAFLSGEHPVPGDPTRGASAGEPGHVREDAGAEEEIRRTIYEYLSVLERGDSEAARAFYTEDARLLVPGADLDRSGVVAGIEAAVRAGSVEVLDRETLDLFVHGGAAYETARAVEVFRSGDSADTVRNNIFVRWEKGSDGRWRFDRAVLGPQEAPSAARVADPPSEDNRQLTERPEAEFDRQVERILAHWGSPGAVVAIVKDGETRLSRGYGTTRVGGDRSVEPSTLTSVASVTKPFTSVALAMLVADGRIAWEDPVRKHIPEFEFADAYRTEYTTIRDLIVHRAGLPAVLGSIRSLDYGIPQLLADVSGSEPRIAFRERVDYSQVGLALLGEVIRRASGMSWSAFVQARILDPVGMDSTYPGTETFLMAHPDPGAVHHLMGRAHREEGRLGERPWRGVGHVYAPAGGIVTTAEDAARFIRFLLDGGEVEGRILLEGELIRDLWTPREVEGSPYNFIANPLSEMVGYGLGWISHEYDGNRIVEHPGANFGTSVLALIPGERIGVFVSSAATFTPESDRMVSALKFAAVDFALGRSSRDWIEPFAAEGTSSEFSRTERR
jgi:CubicO group peptidase (beta-lactamase class C family)/pimeloyl-ACP methyl ester carboxylesterase/ketosteroid isomerase-like protein